MSDETIWTIGELAAAADVTPRTIRYYTAEGLLPPPDLHGKYARYGVEHLRRLQLITRLKASYLPLNEIRARIEKLSAGEVAELLAEYKQAPSEAASGSAADYVAQIMQGRLAPPSTETRLGYKTSTHQERGMLPPQAPLGEPAGPETAMPGRPALPHGRIVPVQSHNSTLLSRLVPRAPQESREHGETWQRIALAPGIELHIHEPAAPEMRERIGRLVELADEIFSDSAHS